jgi:uncharacterized protein (DUF342 family)
LKGEKMSKEKNIKQEIIEKIMGAIQIEIAARDEAQKKLLRLKESLGKYETKKETLHQNLAKLIREGLDSVGKGEDPKTSKAINVCKSEINEMETWISELKNNAIPPAEKELEKATDDLSNAINNAVNGLKPDVEAKLNEKISQAADIVTSWMQGINESLQQANLDRGAFVMGQGTGSYRMAVNGEVFKNLNQHIRLEQ